MLYYRVLFRCEDCDGIIEPKDSEYPGECPDCGGDLYYLATIQQKED